MTLNEQLKDLVAKYPPTGFQLFFMEEEGGHLSDTGPCFKRVEQSSGWYRLYDAACEPMNLSAKVIMSIAANFAAWFRIQAFLENREEEHFFTTKEQFLWDACNAYAFLFIRALDKLILEEMKGK